MDRVETQGCRRQRWGGAGLAILRCPHHDRSRAQHPTTPFRSPRALSPVSVGDEYARWNAAYVLGSLSNNDRREFEAHLSTCPSCRESVSELSGMPALLAQLTRDDVVAIDEGGSAAPPRLRPLLLTSLLTKVGRGRRRSRLAIWTLTAVATAVLVVSVLVAIQPHPAAPIAAPLQADSAALTMAPAAASITLASTVSISSHGWGTRIEMTCRYAKAPENSDRDGDEPGDKLAMVVLGRDGSQDQLATWVALTGVTATPSGSTSMPIDQIATVQIVSAYQGDVLLQRSL
ncbi:MAG: hypothetical protein JWR32_4677 [Mycobacterium sp.]|nr:hypothetical protein [Mycobacterium sp.]